MTHYQFWDDPVTDDDHRRAREAGEAATKRAALADGRATWRIQRMQEKPACRECGRSFAYQQYHGRALCRSCSTVVVEAVAPSGGEFML